MSALSFMNFEIAFDKTTRSPSVHAMAVTPLNDSDASSNCVPLTAMRARVFFTTSYFAPASRIELRNSWSLATVTPVKLTTIADFEAASDSVRAFRSFCFVSLVFISLSPHSLNVRELVEQNARAHRSCNIDLLEVPALRGRRL